jgi:enterochelin esterase-like enzyme
MLKHGKLPLILVLWLFSAFGCKEKINQLDDELYSRHLQRHVKLTIISTPKPDESAGLNLLLLNDGQETGQFRVKDIIDSLYRKKLIQPLLVIGIHAGDRIQEYGVRDKPDFLQRGNKAGFYDDFINNELIPFAKKNTGVRKFKTMAIAGCSQGGLSAFDFAWEHANKIDKVGVFSGSFWWRDKDANAADYTDDKNRIMLNKIRSSRKKAALKYWFYAGGKEETGDRDKDSIIDVIDDTRDLVEIIKSKNICLPEDIRFVQDPKGKHDYESWSKQLPAFLIWAFGK